MDRLEAMATLLAVVEAGSLSAASRRLGTPLATVSRRLSELEDHLQTRLLHRSSRRITLTDAGAAYVEACRRILDQIDEAEHIASGEYRSPKGELTVTASLALGRRHVVPVAAAFLEAYPEIWLRLRLTDLVIDLQEERIDLAIRVGALPDSGLIVRQIGTIREVVCAGPGYIARRGRPETPEDLANHDCVSVAGLTNAGKWEFSIRGAVVPVAVRSRLVVDAEGSGVRCGACRSRHHPAVLASRRRRGQGRRADSPSERLRAASIADQHHLFGRWSSAPQSPRLRRFCGAAAQGAARLRPRF
jgi:DNA-binding transcriptional LysR family regulator